MDVQKKRPVSTAKSRARFSSVSMFALSCRNMILRAQPQKKAKTTIARSKMDGRCRRTLNAWLHFSATRIRQGPLPVSEWAFKSASSSARSVLVVALLVAICSFSIRGLAAVAFMTVVTDSRKLNFMGKRMTTQ